MQSQEKGILMIDSEMDGFVAEAIKAANESKLKKEQEAKQNKSVKTENPVFKRITDGKGFKENDAKMLAIMYVDLASNDVKEDKSMGYYETIILLTIVSMGVMATVVGTSKNFKTRAQRGLIISFIIIILCAAS